MDARGTNAFIKKHPILDIKGYTRLSVADKIKAVNKALTKKSPAYTIPREEWIALKKQAGDKIAGGGGKKGVVGPTGRPAPKKKQPDRKKVRAPPKDETDDERKERLKRIRIKAERGTLGDDRAPKGGGRVKRGYTDETEREKMEEEKREKERQRVRDKAKRDRKPKPKRTPVDLPGPKPKDIQDMIDKERQRKNIERQRKMFADKKERDRLDEEANDAVSNVFNIVLGNVMEDQKQKFLSSRVKAQKVEGQRVFDESRARQFQKYTQMKIDQERQFGKPANSRYTINLVKLPGGRVYQERIDKETGMPVYDPNDPRRSWKNRISAGSYSGGNGELF